MGREGGRTPSAGEPHGTPAGVALRSKSRGAGARGPQRQLSPAPVEGRKRGHTLEGGRAGWPDTEEAPGGAAGAAGGSADSLGATGLRATNAPCPSGPCAPSATLLRSLELAAHPLSLLGFPVCKASRPTRRGHSRTSVTLGPALTSGPGQRQPLPPSFLSGCLRGKPPARLPLLQRCVLIGKHGSASEVTLSEGLSLMCKARSHGRQPELAPATAAGREVLGAARGRPQLGLPAA